jgi:hypothetical protein
MAVHNLFWELVILYIMYILISVLMLVEFPSVDSFLSSHEVSSFIL